MPIPTFYARKLESLLKKLGIKVNEEVWDGHKTIDLSVPRGKLDIEVDGVQHLTNPDQIVTDYTRSYYSREAGYETLHVHNKDIKDDKDAQNIASAIAEVAATREEAFDVLYGIKTEVN